MDRRIILLVELKSHDGEWTVDITGGKIRWTDPPHEPIVSSQANINKSVEFSMPIDPTADLITELNTPKDTHSFWPTNCTHDGIVLLYYGRRLDYTYIDRHLTQI